MKYAVSLLALFVSLSLVACGGGGGGDDFNGAARVQIDAEPGEIDAGDRTQVTTQISEVHPDGIALKYSYPVGLDYVIESALLTVGDLEINVGPVVNSVIDDQIFLVFFFSQELFGEELRGQLRFELEASASVRNGNILVDADVDDALIENAVEFQADNPQFQAEDGTGIEVLS